MKNIDREMETYTVGSYNNMLPGTVVIDRNTGSFWEVLSNDGTTVKLSNVSDDEKNGTEILVSDKTCTMTFVKPVINRKGSRS